jgi:hypothetical protein
MELATFNRVVALGVRATALVNSRFGRQNSAFDATAPR